MAISGLLERFKKGLARTAKLFNIRSWFGRKVDQSFLDELESRLIQADVGVAATTRLIERVREKLRRQDGRRGLAGVRQVRAQGPAGGPQAGDAGRRLQAADAST